ncbi:MAG: hypothetical protein E3K36_08080 [Candidatus Brocadia sp.]|nr:hypothetical protein [Candidatus Brocadia sp.]
MKKHLTLVGWFSFVTILSLIFGTKGYSNNLYETSLTVASSSSYSAGAEAKISISDTGKVKLFIEGLRSADDQLINQDSILVTETEINDSPKTYSESFTITDGRAELEFTLDNLDKGDKLEILNVVINKATSPTPTPIITASPTPTSSPIATPVATPTPSLTRTSSILAILVPGGIISEFTAATPTPITTPSATPVASPTATPAVIQADVDIKPETINLKSHGKFKAFIKFDSDSPYDVNNIVTKTVECEGAEAIDGKVDEKRFIATFNRQDLDLDSETNFYGVQKRDEKEKQELTVTGELEDGTRFEGSDTVKIKDRGTNDDNDD